MIANLAITDYNKYETISTCRFAQVLFLCVCEIMCIWAYIVGPCVVL